MTNISIGCLPSGHVLDRFEPCMTCSSWWTSPVGRWSLDCCHNDATVVLADGEQPAIRPQCRSVWPAAICESGGQPQITLTSVVFDVTCVWTLRATVVLVAELRPHDASSPACLGHLRRHRPSSSSQHNSPLLTTVLSTWLRPGHGTFCQTLWCRRHQTAP